MGATASACPFARALSIVNERFQGLWQDDSGVPVRPRSFLLPLSSGCRLFEVLRGNGSLVSLVPVCIGSDRGRTHCGSGYTRVPFLKQSVTGATEAGRDSVLVAAVNVKTSFAPSRLLCWAPVTNELTRYYERSSSSFSLPCFFVRSSFLAVASLLLHDNGDNGKNCSNFLALLYAVSPATTLLVRSLNALTPSPSLKRFSLLTRSLALSRFLAERSLSRCQLRQRPSGEGVGERQRVCRFLDEAAPRPRLAAGPPARPLAPSPSLFPLAAESFEAGTQHKLWSVTAAVFVVCLFSLEVASSQAASKAPSFHARPSKSLSRRAAHYCHFTRRPLCRLPY